MEQKVKVRRLLPEGRAEVIRVRESACSGDCHKCSGCGAAKQTVILTARNAIGARVGDMVVVSSDSARVLKAAAVMYMLPMVLFFGGYALGASLWQQGGLIGGLAFLASIGLAVLYDRRVVKKQNTGYTIIRFAK